MKSRVKGTGSALLCACSHKDLVANRKTLKHSNSFNLFKLHLFDQIVEKKRNLISPSELEMRLKGGGHVSGWLHRLHYLRRWSLRRTNAKRDQQLD